MKFLKSSWKIYLAVLAGFAVGALMFHTQSVKAQYGQSSVTVQEVPRFPHSGVRSITLPSSDSRVVGFSCLQSGEEPECYVASSPAR